MGFFDDIGLSDWWKTLGLSGTKSKMKQYPTLTKSQQGLHQQLINALSKPGAGGAFGQSADYYRDLLDPNSQTAQEMFAPEQRYFNEDVIPGLSEQFAGMGAGNLSSSGFRNAAVGAGTDLAERLGAIRAQLKQQGAQGLSNLGSQGLHPIVENVYKQGQPGILEQAAPLLGGIAGTMAFGPAGGAAGYQAGSMFKNRNSLGGSQVGRNTSPYGRNAPYPNQAFF